LYVYTGIIKYLKAEDHLAGVLAHEIAHSDRRHSTKQMTQQYGIQTLLSIAFGKNPGMLAQIAAGLANLKFSREDETEADTYSVRYLCQNPAKYEADGAAGFFQQLIDEGDDGGIPEFLSTHPNPDNRVQNIELKAQELGCDTGLKAPATYEDFKKMLP
ncbi:MAG TPA: M48 family metalloprotease, partial [Cytophagaceae bacterium]